MDIFRLLNKWGVRLTVDGEIMFVGSATHCVQYARNHGATFEQFDKLQQRAKNDGLIELFYAIERMFDID